MGFLNPALYKIGQGPGYTAAFHDITTGNNFSGRSPTRFAAVAGYDLCTGWGTPNGTNLINALAGLPTLAPVIVSNSFTLVAEICTNGVVDPGETVTVNFGLTNTGTADTTNLVATLLATGGIVSPSGPQTVRRAEHQWHGGGATVYLYRNRKLRQHEHRDPPVTGRHGESGHGDLLVPAGPTQCHDRLLSELRRCYRPRVAGRVDDLEQRRAIQLGHFDLHE